MRDAFVGSTFDPSPLRSRPNMRIYDADGPVMRVIGKERTGSNYINYLLSTNLACSYFVGVLGGKHNTPTLLSRVEGHELYQKIKHRRVVAVISIKNPYLWLGSIASWRPGMNFHNKWLPQTHYIEEYSHVYRQHKLLVEGKLSNTIYTDAVVMPYEEMLADPQAGVQRIAEYLGVEVMSEHHNPIRVNFSKPFPPEKREYYLRQQPKYGNRLIKKVNEWFDWDVMNFYGYKKIDV